MKKILFWLTLALSVATTASMMTACGTDKDEPKKETPTDPTAKADTTDVGVIIRGVKWATRNVDAPGTFAKTSKDPGMFYQWNRKLGWKYSETLQASDGSSTWNSSGAAGSTWAKENDPCPCGWRVPTNSELQSLVSAGSVWSDVSAATLPGRVFGDGNNSLFLPAAGDRDLSSSTLGGAGLTGYYWSSTVDGAASYYLHFSSRYVYSANSSLNRAYGLSVRCVAE
ncbi:MAG: fibrobacter succinogenes major paralogous domain-containing protein [Prevotellaceae bacterium]|jgi:uncharacterized protein (TIGR02145 family)|nr:fibrobacter succinogenes major paralogous domain-containing protein [Prevotellaceae bacterium]